MGSSAWQRTFGSINDFSLVSLFLVLLVSRIKSLKGGDFWSAVVEGSIALVFRLLGHTSWGVLAASVTGPLFAVYVRRWGGKWLE